MSVFDHDMIAHCDGPCGSCGGARGGAGEPEIHGVGLVGRAAAVFMLPLMAMAAGAAWGRDGVEQLAGALAGGLVGVLLARWLARPAHRSGEKAPI